MKSHIICDSRIKYLNAKPVIDGDYVLYWMQQSQRAEDNHALEFAVELANARHLPVRAVFCLVVDYPEAHFRDYRFMLEGLFETRAALARRKIPMTVISTRAAAPDLPFAEKAAAVVVDRGYLRHQKKWRSQLAERSGCRVVQVESDVVVPVEAVSAKAEYAARTIRPKIHRHLKDYLVSVPTVNLEKSGMCLNVPGLDISSPEKVLQKLGIKNNLPDISHHFTGGASAARKRFSGFMEERLTRYEKNSNQPQTDDISHMSPYLHFGQISPLYLALEIHRADGIPGEAKAAFLEQLVVRRELAANFVNHTANYDQYDCLPGWARQTLADHATDARPHIYTVEELEAADTHDPYWNAAMNEMVHTGFMHNYMRMYWAKKILEWMPSAQQAFDTTLYLNNKYFLDGRDPNSYTGVAWCYGIHDRAWKERAIFGKVRYMAASGLERKCDINGYVRKVASRIAATG